MENQYNLCISTSMIVWYPGSTQQDMSIINEN